MALPHPDELLAYLDQLISDQEKQMLDGGIPAPGDKAESGWVNYRAAVVRRRDLYRIRDKIIEIMKTGEPKDELEEMPEGEKR